jgi:hypothetical protein
MPDVYWLGFQHAPWENVQKLKLSILLAIELDFKRTLLTELRGQACLNAWKLQALSCV